MKKITTSAYMPTHIEVEKISDNVAKIIAYPFETGYAVTLAHPLRRLLFMSTVGFAPTGVKIDGASHEFDAIRGMFEDVAVFIINLKKIRFKLTNDTKREVLEYEFEGPKEIKGSDLNNALVEIVNPDAYLATINEDVKLKFQVIVEKGIGYVPSEELRDYIDSDYIALDAFFTPVIKAKYDIENVLVGDNPDYEKIIFTITTDGQIGPIDAFKNSLESMYQQMSVFKDIVNIDINETIKQNSKDKENSKLFESIESLNLSARSFNCLDKSEIQFIGELALMEQAEIKEIKNLGKKSLEEIKSVMEEIGYPLGSPDSIDNKEAIKNKIEELKKQKTMNEGN